MIWGAALLLTVGFSQSGPIDLDHPIYPWLIRQAALGNIPQGWTGVKPLSWQQVSHLLKTLNQHEHQLSDLDRQVISRWQREFAFPSYSDDVIAPWQLGTWAEAGRQLLNHDINQSPYPHSLVFNDSTTSIWADWREDFRLQNNGNNSRGYYTDRLVFHGTLSNHVSFFWDFIQYRISNVTKYPDLPPEYKQGHIIDQKELDWYVWSLGQAGLYSQFQNFGFSIAQQPIYWGFSPRLSPILNTNVLPYSYLNFTVDYKVVHFTNLQAGLLADMPSEIKKGLPEKRLAAQRLSVDFTPDLTLSFNEFEIYARRPFEPGYLVPIIFYWASENTLGDRDNLLMAVDGIYRVKPGLQVYGTFFWDEMDWFAIMKDSWKNKFAPQIGVYYILPTTRIGSDLRIEYTRVHPWTYTHDDSLSNYTSARTGLGFPFGPNSATLDVQSNWWLTPRLSCAWEWTWLKKGTILGSDPNDNYASRDTTLDEHTTALMGPIQNRYMSSFQFRYRVNTLLEVTGNYSRTDGDVKNNLIEFAARFDW